MAFSSMSISNHGGSSAFLGQHLAALTCPAGYVQDRAAMGKATRELVPLLVFPFDVGRSDTRDPALEAAACNQAGKDVQLIFHAKCFILQIFDRCSVHVLTLQHGRGVTVIHKVGQNLQASQTVRGGPPPTLDRPASPTKRFSGVPRCNVRQFESGYGALDFPLRLNRVAPIL